MSLSKNTDEHETWPPWPSHTPSRDINHINDVAHPNIPTDGHMDFTMRPSRRPQNLAQLKNHTRPRFDKGTEMEAC